MAQSTRVASAALSAGKAGRSAARKATSRAFSTVGASSVFKAGSLRSAPAARRGFGVRYASSFKVHFSPTLSCHRVCARPDSQRKGKRTTWNYAERGQASRRQRLVCVTNTPTYRPQVDYDKHVAERAEMGVVPKPLDPKQCAELCKLLQDPPKGELFCTPRVIPGLPPSLSPS